MTKSTHFGSNRNFSLSKAVLVYSDGQEAFATVHEAKPSPDGGAPYLDAGQALSIDFLKQLSKGLGRTAQCEILPPNVLVYTPEMLVWWTSGLRQSRLTIILSRWMIGLRSVEQPFRLPRRRPCRRSSGMPVRIPEWRARRPFYGSLDNAHH